MKHAYKDHGTDEWVEADDEQEARALGVFQYLCVEWANRTVLVLVSLRCGEEEWTEQLQIEVDESGLDLRDWPRTIRTNRRNR